MSHRSHNHDNVGPFYTAADEAREEAIEARAAEILADNNELLDAACENLDVALALCEVARICMDRTGWTWHPLHGSAAPPSLLIATTALRAAISEYARRELEKESRE